MIFRIPNMSFGFNSIKISQEDQISLIETKNLQEKFLEHAVNIQKKSKFSQKMFKIKSISR